MRKYILLFFAVLQLSARAQHVNIRCLVLDAATHDTMKNVPMAFAYFRYNAKTKASESDTLKSSTDKNGLVTFSLHSAPPFLIGQFKLLTTGSRYRHDSYFIALADTARLIRYYLFPPNSPDYLVNFYFRKNSATPVDTSLFYQWDLHRLHATSPTIIIRGFYSPGEDKQLAKKRADAVLQGFTRRGANPQAFVIELSPTNELTVSRDEHILDDSAESFFSKGTVVNKAYIATLKGKRKVAACQLMQSVQLARY